MNDHASDFVNNTDQVIARLRRIKIVPVLVLETLKDGMRICEILQMNGLATAEITFRTKPAESIIREVSKTFPELLVGAGTVLSVENLERAIDAGAKFAVSPGFNPAVVARAVELGFPFMPGVCTPSEIEQAMTMSVRHFKFFPAEAMGGVNYLKNIIAPYRHLGVSFMPTGGLNPGNVSDYLAVSRVSACGGTWIGKAADIATDSWEKIEVLVKDAVELARKMGDKK